MPPPPPAVRDPILGGCARVHIRGLCSGLNLSIFPFLRLPQS